jgi:hypothetical protein
MVAALLLSSGVALAFKEIQCETDIKCVGTHKVVRMAGTDGFRAMYASTVATSCTATVTTTS